MKKIIGLIAIVLCVSVYYCSNNSKLTAKYTEFRDNTPFLRFEKYQYGDLYGLSLLSGFKETISFTPKVLKDSVPKNINLFIFCDSYLHHKIASDNLEGVNNLSCMRWWYPPTAVCLQSVDSSKRNVIVIEMSERFVREIGEHPEWAYGLLKIAPAAAPAEKSKPQPLVASASVSDLRLFNPHLSSNLEFNMFDYPLFNYVKQWKADFNYHVFGRLSKEVFVDDDKHQLYFSPTVMRDTSTSSFAPVDKPEIDKIVRHFNEISKHYKLLGFNEVYLSIIPNPVTCIHPGLMKYNELISQIYSNDSLQLPTIDVYPTFKTNPQKYYFRSDTHWNTNGLQVWLDEVNGKLVHEEIEK